jgi:hypothetical protein
MQHGTPKGKVHGPQGSGVTEWGRLARKEQANAKRARRKRDAAREAAMVVRGDPGDPDNYYVEDEGP